MGTGEHSADPHAKTIQTIKRLPALLSPVTGVIALAIEHIAKDFYRFNITQDDIIQTPYGLTRER